MTVAWLRARAGSPNGRALFETLVRTLAVVVLAGGCARTAAELIPASMASSLIALGVGGGVYAVLVLGLVRFFGDAPLRTGIDRLFRRLLGRSGPGLPS